MTTRDSERRGRTRYAVHLPINVSDVGTGSTIDLSATGVAFEIDRGLEPGTEIHFELPIVRQNSTLTCDGRVLRVETRDARLFAAATIENVEIRSTTENYYTF